MEEGIKKNETIINHYLIKHEKTNDVHIASGDRLDIVDGLIFIRNNGFVTFVGSPLNVTVLKKL